MSLRRQPPEQTPPADESEATHPLHYLARAIVERRAVIYVGAGASLAAAGKESKVPDWNKLIKNLKSRATASLKDEEGREYLEQLISKEQYLEAADVIQSLLDKDLDLELWDVFDEPAKPSDVHFSIARIPFSMSVTTNFDRLLEAADQTPKTILTWRDPEAILQAIQFRWPIVVKTHGSVGNGPTIILGGRQYRGLMYANPRFQNLLKWIFMTRTFLFVGSSLNDPDLTHLFHEAISEYPATFGPHYAFLPITEATQLRVRNLYESLRIRVIPIEIWPKDYKNYENEIEQRVAEKAKELEKQGQKRLENASSEELGTVDQENARFEQEKKKSLEDFLAEARNAHESSMKWLSEGITRQLTSLSGEVAKQIVTSAPPALPSSDDRTFFLVRALDALLKKAVESTGSFRGDVCLSDDDLGGSRMSGKLKYKISKGPTEIKVLGQKEVAANSVCGIAYYKSRSDQGVYIPDVQTPKIDDRCKLEHYGQIDYLAGHTEVRSELALPIDADGVRVGVLNLESLVPSAYTEDHVRAAKWFTDKAGRMFAAVNERERRARVLELDGTVARAATNVAQSTLDSNDQPPATDERVGWFEAVLKLFDRLWTLRAASRDSMKGRLDDDRSKNTEKSPILYCAVYKVDYRNGCLVSSERANNLDEDQNQMKYGFDEPALATAVFRDRAPYFYPDLQKAINEGRVSKKHLKKAVPSGSILGFPIYIRGHIAGVVLVWGRKMELDDLQLFSRAAHALANTKKHEQMLHLVNLVLDFFDPEKPTEFNPDKSIRIKNLPGRCKAVASLLDEFLRLLSGRFLGELASDLERNRENLPIPKRARLWVQHEKIGPDKEALPTFLVTCEVIVGAKENENPCWPKFNLPYTSDYKKRGAEGALMFTRPEHKAKAERNLASGPDTAITDMEGDQPHAKLAPNNRYLSFLLSRYPADPFTRVQYPQIFGPDAKADWLGQHRRQPWYVAPLLASPSEGVKAQNYAEVGGKVENDFKCLGYLTLDEGYYKSLSDIAHWRRADESVLTDEQFKKLFNDEGFCHMTPDRKFEALKKNADQSLVNEMMHLIDFFVSCLTILSPFMQFAEELQSARLPECAS